VWLGATDVDGLAIEEQRVDLGLVMPVDQVPAV
jgi:hypothetical protein